MKTNNDNMFNKIFVGVLVLHIIFLYILPGFSKIVVKKPEISKITIGVINNDIKSAPKKVEEKKKEKKIVEEKEIIPVEKKIEKKVEKPKPKVEVAEKEVIKKDPPKKVQKKILTTTQSFNDLDIMKTAKSEREIPKSGEKIKPKIIKIKDEESSKGIKDIKLNEVNDNITSKIDENLDSVKIDMSNTESENIVVTNDKPQIKDIKVDNILSEDNPNVEGPKSGLKIGSIDGKSKVIWDPSNKDPEYPLEAEKKAQTADVKIILEVDESGKVLSVRLIKTGVDVIDRAVERVARSWNVKLINAGMAVSGSVIVEYQFKLKGRE